MSFTLYILALPTIIIIASLINGRKFRAIPTVGSSDFPLLTYLGALNFARNGPALLQEGYDKFKGRIFKVSTFERWLVVISGHKLVDEFQKLPEAKVSLNESIAELINTRWIFGQSFHDNPYHVRVVQQQLTRHIGAAFPEIQDEIEVSFEELLPVPANGEWVSVPVLSVMRQIVARVSNRVFVGLPYCRNESYLDLAIRFMEDVDYGSYLLLFVPRWLKGLAARYLTNINGRVDLVQGYLHDLLQKRVQDMEQLDGDWEDKPNDMLQWLMDEQAKTGDLDMKNVVRMILIINFAAISTSSMSFTHALYHLAANPEYIVPLREEAEAIVKEEGYTKVAMSKMRKIDSFLRESLRYNDIHAFTLMRKAMQDVQLSDGSVIPSGAIVLVPGLATHYDEANYTDAATFDPWRFYNMREEEGNSLKYQYTNTALDYMVFGHGKHACPGRFFAANELKAMMVHTLINYDVKLANQGVRPPNKWVGLAVSPDPSAEVLFKRRVVSPDLKNG